MVWGDMSKEVIAAKQQWKNSLEMQAGRAGKNQRNWNVAPIDNLQPWYLVGIQEK